jgi:hypothetical protein
MLTTSVTTLDGKVYTWLDRLDNALTTFEYDTSAVYSEITVARMLGLVSVASAMTLDATDTDGEAMSVYSLKYVRMLDCVSSIDSRVDCAVANDSCELSNETISLKAEASVGCRYVMYVIELTDDGGITDGEEKYVSINVIRL